MKKIIIVFFCLFLLCSCSSGKEIAPALKGISFKGVMTHYNEEYSFLAEIGKEGELKCEMTAPDTLKGMVIRGDREGTRVEYKGISYSPVQGSMPFSAIMERFYECLLDAMESDALADEKGVLKTEDYTLTLSPSGLPQKLTIEKDGFYITFYNISVKEE